MPERSSPRTPATDGNGDYIIDYGALSTPLDLAMFDRLPLARRQASVFMYLAGRAGFLRVIPFERSPDVNRYRAVYDPSRGDGALEADELIRLVRWLNDTGFLEAYCLTEGNPTFTTGEAVPSFLMAGAYERLDPTDAATVTPYVNVADHPVAWN